MKSRSDSVPTGPSFKVSESIEFGPVNVGDGESGFTRKFIGVQTRIIKHS